MTQPPVTEPALAPYAIRSSDCGGRAHSEPDDPLRSPFEFDRHRIIESTAFRRLEGKTQVFAAAHHDHFRTRLTHSLEVAQVARCLAAGLRANEHLAEAIALAHDLGHPPFGHAGEVALNEMMGGDGGFNHNTHSLRVVEHLEHPFPPFRGLNLTAATRAGLRGHATRYDKPGLPQADDELSGFETSVEAEAVSVADRVAYSCHDLEDAIGAGFVHLEDLAEVALWRIAHNKAAGSGLAAHIFAIRRAVLDALLDNVLADVIAASRDRLAGVESREQLRFAPAPVVAPSAEVDARLAELEQFLAVKVYQHPEVTEMDARGRDMVRALFEAYGADPRMLPDRFAARIADQGLDRVICDYLAGMTDRFCQREHARLVDNA